MQYGNCLVGPGRVGCGMADTIAAGKLAQDLENVSGLALRRLADILDLPLDIENGALLRAVTTAANIALNTQTRVDALRLRAQRDDKALKELLNLIAAKEQTTPSGQGMNESCFSPMGSLGSSAHGSV
jgi:hypothetical protein